MASEKFSCDSYPRCPSTNDANVGSDASPGVELMQIFDHLVVSLLSSGAADWRRDSQPNTSYIIQFLGAVLYSSVKSYRVRGKHLKFTGMGIDIKSANTNFAAILGWKFGWGGRIRKRTPYAQKLAKIADFQRSLRLRSPRP